MRHGKYRLNKSILHIFIEFLYARNYASYCRQNKNKSETDTASRNQEKCLGQNDKVIMYKYPVFKRGRCYIKFGGKGPVHLSIRFNLTPNSLAVRLTLRFKRECGAITS